MPEETEKKAYKCRHIFTDGHRCGAKCLRREHFCYYHHTTRKPASGSMPKAAPATPAETTFDLPNPEDRTAIQISIGEVLRRVARNQIDPRRAGLLLYGLQIASLNLPPEPRSASTRSRNPRARGRTIGRHDQAPAAEEPIEAYDLDPTLGPLAPIAEFAEPEEELSFVGQLLKEMVEDPTGQLPTLQAAAEPHRVPQTGDSTTVADLGLHRPVHHTTQLGASHLTLKTRRAAASTNSTSSAPCAMETKAASYCEGGSHTPASSIPR